MIVSGFNTFLDLGEAGKLDVETYQKIKELYSLKVERIKLSWSKLPMSATQGNISINNPTLKEISEFLNYKIAGDETLVGEIEF